MTLAVYLWFESIWVVVAGNEHVWNNEQSARIDHSLSPSLSLALLFFRYVRFACYKLYKAIADLIKQPYTL